ncbi:MAG: aromatic ring-hydroxylating dioxygenase subunit alpha [Pseudomonadota bacterium]
MKTYADQIKSVKDYINLPFAYDHWYVAGFREEFGREPKAKTLLERSIVFYRTEAGEISAFQNRCLHRSFPLSEGYLEGDNLVCRYHGIRYAPDGSVVRVPCQDKKANRKLRTYPLREHGPYVFIWMGDPDHPEIDAKFPNLFFLEDETYRTVHDEIGLEGNYLLMQENLNDLTHFAYLHKDSFGFDDSFFETERVVEKREDGVYCKYIEKQPTKSLSILPVEAQEEMLAADVSERWDEGVALSPGVFRGYAPFFAGAEDDPNRKTFNQYVLHYLTPETRSTSHYWWSISADYGLDNDLYFEMLKGIIGTGFEEDLWACKHMQTLLDNDKIEFDEMIIAGDQAGLLFRRMMLDWITAEHGESPPDA